MTNIESRKKQRRSKKKAVEKYRTDRMNKEDVMTGTREFSKICGMNFDVYILIRSHTH